ncbi:Histone H2B, partial [Armadillidium vulgare]
QLGIVKCIWTLFVVIFIPSLLFFSHNSFIFNFDFTTFTFENIFSYGEELYTPLLPKLPARLRNLSLKETKKKKESYSIYIYKVLKQVRSDTRISSKTMSIYSYYHKNFCQSISFSSFTTRDQPSPPGKFKLLSGSCFLEKLAKHAVSEGTKAVTKYTSSNRV